MAIEGRGGRCSQSICRHSGTPLCGLPSPRRRAMDQRIARSPCQGRIRVRQTSPPAHLGTIRRPSQSARLSTPPQEEQGTHLSSSLPILTPPLPCLCIGLFYSQLLHLHGSGGNKEEGSYLSHCFSSLSCSFPRSSSGLSVLFVDISY